MSFHRGIRGPAISNTSVGAIPAAATQVTDKRAVVDAFFLSNPTAGALDVTIRDGGTTGTIVMVITVAAKTAGFYPIYAGEAPLVFPNGISWNAASSGMFGEVIGTVATV